MFRNGFLGSKLVEMKKKFVQIVQELWFLWTFVFPAKTTLVAESLARNYAQQNYAMTSR